VDFDALQRRLLDLVRSRLRNGELTERRLAHLTGISQPHVHNVLKGARILSIRATDRILRQLELTVVDLIDKEAAAARFCAACCRYPEVPVLEGWLGPGLPIPKQASKVERIPFPRSYLVSVENAVVARLAHDPHMGGLLQANDLALLDQSPDKRRALDKHALYVVNRRGEGVIRRLRHERADLLVLSGVCRDWTEHLEALPLAGHHLLDVVKARVVWLGRLL